MVCRGADRKDTPIMEYTCRTGLSDDSIRYLLRQAVAGKKLSKILLLPPDFTRMYSGAGKIVAMLWDMLADHARST